jgi:hypothetical protein
MRWLYVVVILLVGECANNSLSFVSCCHCHYKCLFRTAFWNLYFVYFSILDVMIRLWVREAELLTNKINIYACDMELTKRRNEKSLASHPAGTRTRSSEIRQKHMERELCLSRGPSEVGHFTWAWVDKGFITEIYTLHKYPCIHKETDTKKKGMYQMKCMDCPLKYAGQTKAIFYTRYKVHIQAITNNNRTSYTEHRTCLREYNRYNESNKNREERKTPKYFRKLPYV